jgi:hypothetical protein
MHATNTQAIKVGDSCLGGLHNLTRTNDVYGLKNDYSYGIQLIWD